MTGMSASQPLACELPPAADGAVAIVRRLVKAGHVALLAGGCVRDLLIGRQPVDYDVATDAPPEHVRGLFRSTRLVGAQFGVVLVRQRRRWVEVATFRNDGPYRDGRHPEEVTFTDAQTDARRRDFTVNGMFLDPLERRVIDYVGGQADLQARTIRAIGQPTARFEEDHLRMLRAVRFAARLGFNIEPVTLAAVRANAAKLSRVAAERVRDELEKVLVHPSRQEALALLHDTGLLSHLWAGASWRPEQVQAALDLLARLPEKLSFELAFAALVADRRPNEVHAIGRGFTFSNEQRETVAWLVAHQADLDEPEAIALSALKRLMAHRAFASLRQWSEGRYAAISDGAQRRAALEKRLAAIPAEAIQPRPFVTGADLAARGLSPGPIYAEILDTLYTRQLNEAVSSRDEACAALDEFLRERGLAQ